MFLKTSVWTFGPAVTDWLCHQFVLFILVSSIRHMHVSPQSPTSTFFQVSVQIILFGKQMHFMYFVHALFTQPVWLSCLLFDSTKINVQWDLWQNESVGCWTICQSLKINSQIKHNTLDTTTLTSMAPPTSIASQVKQRTPSEEASKVLSDNISIWFRESGSEQGGHANVSWNDG